MNEETNIELLNMEYKYNSEHPEDKINIFKVYGRWQKITNMLFILIFFIFLIGLSNYLGWYV